MATRAIHLEVVDSLSTDAFMDAYECFASTRGNCISITSDNGTNFVGAKNRLNVIRDIWMKCAHLSRFVNQAIEWRFIPPHSPHQGGLWEAAVKSFKHHLYRTVEIDRITILELKSLAKRIEACLNSRPIGVVHEEGTDAIAITPAHFLIGRELRAIATQQPTTEKQSYFSRWRKIQHLHQYFWQRWQADHVNFLLTRSKWQAASKNLAIGDIVLLKEDNYPPQHWPLGVVTKLVTGKDQLVRTVFIKTKKGETSRTIHKLVKLPVNEEEEE